MKKIVKRVLTIGAISMLLSPANSFAAGMNWTDWGSTSDDSSNITANCGAGGQTEFQCANAMQEAGFMQRFIVATDGSRYIQTVIAEGNNTGVDDRFMDQSIIRVDGLEGNMMKQDMQETGITGTAAAADHEIFTSSFAFDEGSLVQTSGYLKHIALGQNVTETACDASGGGDCSVVGMTGVAVGGKTQGFGAGITLDELVRTDDTAAVELHLTGMINDVVGGFQSDFEMGEAKQEDASGNELSVIKGVNQGQTISDTGFTSDFRIKEVVNEGASTEAVEITMGQTVALSDNNAKTAFDFIEMSGTLHTAPSFMNTAYTTGYSGSGSFVAVDDFIPGAGRPAVAYNSANEDTLIGLQIDQFGGDPNFNFGDFAIRELVNESSGKESVIGGLGQTLTPGQGNSTTFRSTDQAGNQTDPFTGGPMVW